MFHEKHQECDTIESLDPFNILKSRTVAVVSSLGNVVFWLSSPSLKDAARELSI